MKITRINSEVDIRKYSLTDGDILSEHFAVRLFYFEHIP